MAQNVIVVTCPACEAELDTEIHPLQDWKRGTVRYEVVLSEEAIAHLVDHFGGEPITPDTDAPEEPAQADAPGAVQVDAVPAAETADQPAPELVADPVQETSDEAPIKAIPKTKTRTKTA